VEGAPRPILATKGDFAARLEEAEIDPFEVLSIPVETVVASRSFSGVTVSKITHVRKTDDWLTAITLPLKTKFAGQDSYLSARIDLSRLLDFIEQHPFADTGLITLVDAAGVRILDPARVDLSSLEIVADATAILEFGSRTISVAPYARPNGVIMLGAFSFPEALDWAIIVEKSERDAYLAIDKMLQSLALWIVLGFAIAITGSILFALRISRPILEIDKVANEVGQGNFTVRVEKVTSKDEIGDLAIRMNRMITGLAERFELQKFVSEETIAAIKGSDSSGVKLGGEKRSVTMMFSDIRGFTAFSERVDPQVVVEMLNLYLSRQAEIVEANGGDIDKFVGDELVAIFQGEDMARNAVLSALAIQEAIAELNQDHPEWGIAVGIGINSGEVVMGAMGSASRMDYTVLGDNVNLAARLCAHAERGQTLLSENSHRSVADMEGIIFTKLPPMELKGKSEPVPAYGVERKPADESEDAAGRTALGG
jgi:adenylate cyclase